MVASDNDQGVGPPPLILQAYAKGIVEFQLLPKQSRGVVAVGGMVDPRSLDLEKKPMLAAVQHPQCASGHLLQSGNVAEEIWLLRSIDPIRNVPIRKETKHTFRRRAGGEFVSTLKALVAATVIFACEVTSIRSARVLKKPAPASEHDIGYVQVIARDGGFIIPIRLNGGESGRSCVSNSRSRHESRSTALLLDQASDRRQLPSVR